MVTWVYSFIRRWLPEYGQMVEKKETCCWMPRDNNALVLLPNLKNVSCKTWNLYLKSKECLIQTWEKKRWKSPLGWGEILLEGAGEELPCQQWGEGECQARRGNSCLLQDFCLHLGLGLNWDWDLRFGECQAQQGNPCLQLDFCPHLDNSSGDRRTSIGCQKCWW